MNIDKRVALESLERQINSGIAALVQQASGLHAAIKLDDHADEGLGEGYAIGAVCRINSQLDLMKTAIKEFENA
jgi:hypothetical protein